MDKLETLFKLQKDFHAKLGNERGVYTIEYQKEMTLAAIDELMEALRELPWKSWKKNQSNNKELHKEELIDVWHFLINLSLAAGMTAQDVHDAFLQKAAINLKRQERGY